ncbi:MAG: hypothetical protein ACREHD_01205 [Pirellulales bacterium]
MHRMYFVVTAMLVVCAWSRSSPAADDAPRGAAAPLVSEKAVLRETIYSLEADGNRLFLASRDLEGENRKVVREALELAVGDDDRPVELSLAVMGEKNLMAVVKVRHGDEYDFYCLTFIFRWSNDTQSDRFKFFQSKFYTSQRNFKILGISGRHAEGSALVVLGEIPGGKPAADGVIYFSGCPWPPSDGNLLHYRAQQMVDAEAN